MPSPRHADRPHSTVTRDLQIAAADGVALAATLFVPACGSPVACALVGSAMGVRRARYEAFARFLAANGIAVLTFEYRGIGDSAPVPARQSTVTLTEWAEQDMEGLVAWLGRTYPGLPLIGVGHSIGGQLFGLVPSVHRFAALFLVGAQRGYAAYWRGSSRLLIAAFWRVLPAIVRVFGYLPLKVAGCEAIPPRAALEWRCWGLHPDFRDVAGRSQSDRWARFRGRLLSVSFEDDFFAAGAAVAALVRTYAGARAEHLHFSPSDFGRGEIGHSGFFAEDVCPGLWDQVLRWLLRNAAGIEPGAPPAPLPFPAPADRLAKADTVRFAARSSASPGDPSGVIPITGAARRAIAHRTVAAFRRHGAPDCGTRRPLLHADVDVPVAAEAGPCDDQTQSAPAS